MTQKLTDVIKPGIVSGDDVNKLFAIAKEELVSSHNKQKIDKLIEYQQVLKKENHIFDSIKHM